MEEYFDPHPLLSFGVFRDTLWHILDPRYDYESGPHENVLTSMFVTISTAYEVIDAHLREQSARDKLNDLKAPWVTGDQIRTFLRPVTLSMLQRAYAGKDPGLLPLLPSIKWSPVQMAESNTCADVGDCREVIRCITACLFARYAYQRPVRINLRAQLYALLVSLKNAPDAFHRPPPFDLVGDPSVPMPKMPCRLLVAPLEAEPSGDAEIWLRTNILRSGESVRLHGWVAHSVAVVQHHLLCMDIDMENERMESYERWWRESAAARGVEPPRTRVGHTKPNPRSYSWS
ncbi:ORF129 [Ranid herpesvirus 1]|uniref:ORF129 n=1 Tax=Ranid herpesvirus 1 TaxID=85655 RepID=Q14VK1_9VIRU|nr:ORF129 [Ranid herpesvirus 1]ABG25768.1 ORF129 [Ranid herpesvirus 1]